MIQLNSEYMYNVISNTTFKILTKKLVHTCICWYYENFGVPKHLAWFPCPAMLRVTRNVCNPPGSTAFSQGARGPGYKTSKGTESKRTSIRVKTTQDSRVHSLFFWGFPFLGRD